jgi:hypothetical protein
VGGGGVHKIFKQTEEEKIGGLLLQAQQFIQSAQ